MYGQTTKDLALQALRERFTGQPIPTRIVGEVLGITRTGAGKALGHAKESGEALYVRLRGWLPVEKSEAVVK